MMMSSRSAVQDDVLLKDSNRHDSREEQRLQQKEWSLQI